MLYQFNDQVCFLGHARLLGRHSPSSFLVRYFTLCVMERFDELLLVFSVVNAIDDIRQLICRSLIVFKRRKLWPIKVFNETFCCFYYAFALLLLLIPNISLFSIVICTFLLLDMETIVIRMDQRTVSIH